MNSKNIVIIEIVAILTLSMPALAFSNNEGIEGDWQTISDPPVMDEVIKIWRETDGTLSAVVFDENPNGGSETFPFDEVTFENGKLSFERTSKQVVFEGTMKEDGLTIEGQLKSRGRVIALVLKRIDAVPSQTAQTPQEQLQDRISDTSNIDAVPSQTAQIPQKQSQDRISGTSKIATTLIIILVLVGIVGLIVIFFVKSSIR